jgi:hypothetical protein
MMRSIPFYPNDLDAMHCLEACVSSALGYFGQPASFTAADVEKITGFRPGKGTWQFRSYVNLASLGYEIRVWDPIDLRPFTEDTFAYLVEIAGEEMAEDLWENSDVGTAVEDAKLVIENRAIDYRPVLPTLADLEFEIRRGAICVCQVDHSVLLDEGDYEGHAVIVTTLSRDDEMVTLDDPGPPPHPGWTVPLVKFIAAWDSPNEHARSFFSIFLNTNTVMRP